MACGSHCLGLERLHRQRSVTSSPRTLNPTSSFFENKGNKNTRLPLTAARCQVCNVDCNGNSVHGPIETWIRSMGHQATDTLTWLTSSPMTQAFLGPYSVAKFAFCTCRQDPQPPKP